MARPRRRALQPSDIEGLEYFDTLVPLLARLKQVFDSSPAILAVSPFAMERQLYSLATHGATS